MEYFNITKLLGVARWGYHRYIMIPTLWYQPHYNILQILRFHVRPSYFARCAQSQKLKCCGCTGWQGSLRVLRSINCYLLWVGESGWPPRSWRARSRCRFGNVCFGDVFIVKVKTHKEAIKRGYKDIQGMFGKSQWPVVTFRFRSGLWKSCDSENTYDSAGDSPSSKETVKFVSLASNTGL